MALYEITYLTLEESDPGVRTAIEEAGGAIESESSMGRRRLAYPINKEMQAVYTSFVFDVAKTAIAGLDRKFRLNTNILRHLIVVKELPKADKSVSKTVREAIAAAEKLDDTITETKPTVVAPAVEEAPVVEETPAAEEVVETTPEVESTEAPAEEALATTEETTKESTEAKPARKPRAKKTEDAASATEEDRLKALEDKLGEILKD